MIDSVRRVLGMAHPATVRCRGGADSYRARVSLAGGASDERVVIRLADSDVRPVSVRPNRRSLRGAYGLSGERLRAGGSEYAFRLNAVQSTPRGSYLTRFSWGKPRRISLVLPRRRLGTRRTLA